MALPDAEIEARAMTLAEDALARPAATRADFIRNETEGDATVRERALALLEAAEAGESDGAGGRLVTGAGAALFQDVMKPETIGHYRIEREIGRGGMGVVYLGRRADADFEHPTAIKVVSRRDVKGAQVERLRMERRMLARLKHPNIAHFYDGGETPDGHPYFAMEYVDGAPLFAYLEDRAPDLEERLRIFADICAAVSYAHRNLVVHRDLTSANVLITGEGVAKVIDFGIAHSIGGDARAAVGGMTATKGFTAPERLRGEPATTVSDIYSLGVILELLLQGAAAPRKADLDAVAQKARADDPAERYQSVTELSADLERYAAQQAVKARGDDWRLSLVRYVQRRPLAVAAGCLAFLTLTLGGGAMTALYFRAEAAETRATTRFDEVRSLAKVLMFDLYDDLADIPGTAAARERVAGTAQNYLDVLSRTPDAPFDLELETAVGYRRLADIVGVPSGINLGRMDEAGVLLEDAFARLSDLRDRRPENPDVLRAYAQAAYSYVIYEWFGRDDSDATIEKAAAAEEAYKELERLGALSHEDAAVLLDVMTIRASAHIWEDRGEEGLSILRETIALSENLAASQPDNLDIAQARAKLAVDYGDALSREADMTGGDHEAALASLDDGVSQLRDLLSSNPGDPALTRTLASSLWKRANVLYDGHDEEALRDLSEAEGIYRDFYAQDPEDLGTFRNISIVTMQKARSLSSLGRHEDAIRSAREGLAGRINLAGEQPDNTALARGVAESQITLAEILQAGGVGDEACKELREGLEKWRALDESGELSAYTQSNAISDEAPVVKACQG